MKKILVTRRLLKSNEERISKLWNAKLNSNDKQKKRFKERQKQIELSRKKNQSHIGQVKT